MYTPLRIVSESRQAEKLFERLCSSRRVSDLEVADVRLLMKLVSADESRPGQGSHLWVVQIPIPYRKRQALLTEICDGESDELCREDLQVLRSWCTHKEDTFSVVAHNNRVKKVYVADLLEHIRAVRILRRLEILE